MLTHQIRSNEVAESSVKLDCEEWFLSRDKDYMRFVVPYSSELVSGDVLMFKSKFFDDTYSLPITADDIEREGYIIHPHKFPLHSFENGRRYVIYTDGIAYYEHIGEDSEYDGTIVVDGVAHQITESDYIEIPIKLWVENGSVEIDGDSVDVDLDLVVNSDGGYDPQSIYHDGVEYQWFDYEPSKRHYVTRVSVKCKDDAPIRIDGASCCKYVPYVIFGGEKKRVSIEEDNGIKKYFVKEDDGDVMLEVEDTPWMDGDRYAFSVSPKFKLHGENCDLRYELVACDHGSMVFLYLSDGWSLTQDDVVVVTDVASRPNVCAVVVDHIIFCGTKYYKQVGTYDFVKINGVMYEAHYVDDDELLFYIEVGENDKAYFEKVDGTVKRVSMNGMRDVLSDFYVQEEYEFYQYGYYIVNGEKCIEEEFERIIDDGSVISYKAVRVNQCLSYKLMVDNIYDGNIAQCRLLNDDLDSDEYEAESQNVANVIANNYGSCTVTKMVDYFDLNPISKLNDFPEWFEFDTDREFYPWDTFDVYRQITYLCLSVPLSCATTETINQEDAVGNRFVEHVVDDTINPIVDYEKDVYYPSLFDVDDDGNLDVTEISFNLHFRTRDDEWNVDESKDWNMFDRYADFPIDASDLLGFLGFSTMDVYYQKSKIAKSFLRISVYDDINPSTQNLLYLGTVFMDEQKLFKRYMDSFGKKFVLFNATDNLSSTSDMPGVFYEPYDDERKEMTFDEDQRLSSLMTVERRSVTDTSSDGFYLYVFRELGEYLTDVTMYMKIDFCHAGYGKAVPLMLVPPIVQEGLRKKDGERSSEEKDSIEAFKKGSKLQDVYEDTYIPIKAIFDFDAKKYVYTFPKHTYDVSSKGIKLNLFEIKIADES